MGAGRETRLLGRLFTGQLIKTGTTVKMWITRQGVKLLTITSYIIGAS